MLAAVAVKTSQCYLGLGDYSYPKLVYSSSDSQPSPSYFCRHHPSTDDRLSPEPSQADLGHFSPPYNPNNGLTRHDQQTAANSTSLPLLRPCLCSSWQGSCQTTLSRRDSFPSTALPSWSCCISLEKQEKERNYTTNTRDPEISQSLDILPSQGHLAYRLQKPSIPSMIPQGLNSKRSLYQPITLPHLAWFSLMASLPEASLACSVATKLLRCSLPYTLVYMCSPNKSYVQVQQS